MYEALEGGSLPVVEPDEYHARLLGSDFSLPTLAFPEGMDAKLCPPLEVSKERADRVRRGEGAVGSEEGRYTAGGACDVWSRLSDLISSFGNERYEERRAKVLQWWRGHKQAVGMNVGRLVQYGSAWGKDSSAWSDGGQPAAVGATGAASVVTEGECAHYDLACWAEVNRGKDADDSVLHEAIQEARTKVESLFEVWDTGAGDEEPHSHSTWEWDGQGNPPPAEELDVGTYPQPGCRNDCDCAGADSCGGKRDLPAVHRGRSRFAVTGRSTGRAMRCLWPTVWGARVHFRDSGGQHELDGQRCASLGQGDHG